MEMYQQQKRWIYRLLTLVMLVFLGIGACSLRVAATGTTAPVVCVTIEGNSAKSGTIGVPWVLEGHYCILTPKSFYIGSEEDYAAIIGDDLYSMTALDTLAGYWFFEVDAADASSLFYDGFGAVAVGEDCTLVGIKGKGEVVRRSVTIEQVDDENSDGLFPVAFEGDVDGINPLAVLVDENDTLVAICGSDGTFALAAKTEASKGGSSDGGTSDGGASDSGASDSGSSKPSRHEEKEDKKSSSVAVYIGCGVLAAIVVVVLVLTKKKKPVVIQNGGTHGNGGRVDVVQPNNGGSQQPSGSDVPENPPMPNTVYVPPKVPMPHTVPSGVQLSLDVVSGPLVGRSFPISDKTMLIGRALEADIQYPADTKGVSRRHCQIFWEKGTLHIMDLGSTSGTFLRGKGQLKANVSVALTAGDTIYLGSKQVALQLKSRS